MTILYYHIFDEPLSPSRFLQKLGTLHFVQQEKIKKFRRWQDAHASLFGKLLLQKGLLNFGIPNDLANLKTDRNNKPYLDGSSIGFNITHSGNLVACVLTDETLAIGLDAEEWKPLDIADFISCWNDEEWTAIRNNEIQEFYKYWTAKEAVIKAEGQGLGIPLKEIMIKEGRATWNNREYFLEEVDIVPGFSITIAGQHKINKLQLCQVWQSDFL